MKNCLFIVLVCCMELRSGTIIRPTMTTVTTVTAAGAVGGVPPITTMAVSTVGGVVVSVGGPIMSPGPKYTLGTVTTPSSAFLLTSKGKRESPEFGLEGKSSRLRQYISMLEQTGMTPGPELIRVAAELAGADEEKARADKIRREEADRQDRLRMADMQIRQQEADRQERLRREERQQEMQLRQQEFQIRQQEADRQDRLRLADIQLRREEADRQERIRREERREELQIRRDELASQEKVRAEEIAAFKQVKTGVGKDTGSYRVKLAEWDEKDDIDHYLQHFERVATMHQWPEETWASRLVPQLHGSARETFLQLTPEDAGDYMAIKQALMFRFHRDADYYRRQFRGIKKDITESFACFLKRMRQTLSRWFCLSKVDDKDPVQVVNAFIFEQLLASLTPELAIYVREHEAVTPEQAAAYADQRVLARRAVREDKGVGGSDPRKPRPTSSLEGGRRIQSPPAGKTDRKDNLADKTVVCFNCGQKGHMRRDCDKKKKVTTAAVRQQTNPLSTGGVPALCSECERLEVVAEALVTLNGQAVLALRDTGAEMCLVSTRLVEEEDVLAGVRQRVSLADPSVVREYPVASVFIDSPWVRGRIHMLMADQLCHDVILGNTVTFVSGEIVKLPVYANTMSVGAVQTRAQAKRGQQVDPLPVDRVSGLDVTPEELRRLQNADATLDRARAAADSGEVTVHEKTGTKTKFIRRKGLLMREVSIDNRVYKQVCVPQGLRKEVLKLAHDTPMSGHMGVRRTLNRVWQDFHWPKLAGDVRKYCQSCDKCQRATPGGRVPRAPLVRMPLVDQAFDKVAVDIVGPIIPSSDRGYRFILVMVDFATRYPEAVPLKNIRAETVAEALWEMWTRLGIPAEVLTDRGSQFTSEVMQEVYRMLSVKGNLTTPYHAMCNGLVERFNQTLKAMLKKLCTEKPRTWDRYIPALLFAYREVPQESTGFSPFELMFGRTVRGPMQVLKELWTRETDQGEVKSALQHVVDLREKVEETCKIAQESLERHSKKYKRHFDKKARARNIAVGSKVLLLLPCKENKLKMKWRGPYLVKEKVGVCDYRLQVGDKLKTYHINLLKQYKERGSTVASVALLDEEADSEDVQLVSAPLPVFPLKAQESVADINLDPECPEMHQEIKQLVSQFSDILTDLPLRTNLAECEIRMEKEEPVRTRQYPMPYAHRDLVKKEVESMLRLGVIEPSQSPYSSPIVLVRKKDGTIRFCVDFRRLNRVVTFDAEPLPDMEYLFAKLGKAKYLTKIDLSKGYWQIPMVQKDRPKTAFTTELGQFQFVVMPFGLKTAGACFSRMMRALLLPLRNPEVDNFMDDILIASETKRCHLECLRQVLLRLREAHLSARPTKCYMGYRQLEYLGHAVGNGQMKPLERMTEKIKSVDRPTTKKQVRSFLGLVGFYRRFVPQFAETALPLTDLTKGGKREPIHWDERCEKAFQRLKELMSCQPVCCLPDFQKAFVLRTDASDVGIGAVLLQDQGFGLQPVGYVSKKLNSAEKNYSPIEKECLAVVFGIQKYSPFLAGRKFVVQTDHCPLQWLHRVKPQSPRLMRWSLQLQPYDFDVQAIPGRENVDADFLSRNA